MSNILVHSRVRACGDKSQVLALWQLMSKLDHHSASEPNQYAEIMRSLGCEPENEVMAIVHDAVGEATVVIRGHWYNLELLPDGSLSWEDTVPYYPEVEFYHWLEQQFPGLEVFFLGELLKTNCCVTNDHEHKVFPKTENMVYDKPEDFSEYIE